MKKEIVLDKLIEYFKDYGEKILEDIMIDLEDLSESISTGELNNEWLGYKLEYMPEGQAWFNCIYLDKKKALEYSNHSGSSWKYKPIKDLIGE